MNKKISHFVSRFLGETGTKLLMDDLGEVSSSNSFINLGGGNPAKIPKMGTVFRNAMEEILCDESFEEIIGSYDSPQGNRFFLDAVCGLLSRNLGWDINVENVALTTGSQSSFFILFNLFGGLCDDGIERLIQLPLTPEYIGYSDLLINPECLVSDRPKVQIVDSIFFKYEIDFDLFHVRSNTGAICFSRPTHPSGNMLSTIEVEKLIRLTGEAGVPLIVDNAYGYPFPNIVFEHTGIPRADHLIHCFSLSKLGLAGLRTGIVVAQPEIINAIKSMNAAMSLSINGLGQAMVADLIVSDEIIRLSNEVIRPFYLERSKLSIEICTRFFSGLDYRIHVSEGAFFLWLWFPELPISDQLLYERIKERGVLVIPGSFFFPGLKSSWNHPKECIRVSYAQSNEDLEIGIRIISEEVKRCYVD
jgi:valine--pyruvate aminotransferase